MLPNVNTIAERLGIIEAIALVERDATARWIKWLDEDTATNKPQPSLLAETWRL